MQRECAARGASLVIRIGNMTDVLQQLMQEIGVFSLWSHEETGNGWTYKRDRDVAKWCQARGISWTEFPTNGVIRLLKQRDRWSALRHQRMAVPVIQAPLYLHNSLALVSDPLPAKDHPMFGSMQIGSVQVGGRTAGLSVLRSFLDDRSRYYMQTIAKPAASARHCSRLSAHITYGTLSIHEIELATNNKMHHLAASHHPEDVFHHRNLSSFLSRLIWHCHFIQKLESQPEIEYNCIHPAFEGMREPHFREDFFEAWKAGRTGYPLVDACMRSLHQNGWLTFRMRAMLVSFASYDLWLDWRITAPFLAQLFTDYEPGIHYSQFQMQSGVTGMNAMRMYNPIKQSEDHDPQGIFIKRYLPELNAVPISAIHEPWLNGHAKANYPAPIIDHEIAVKHARAEIAKRTKQEQFVEVAKSVKAKLGSRARLAKSAKKTRKGSKSNQLSFDI